MANGRDPHTVFIDRANPAKDGGSSSANGKLKDNSEKQSKAEHHEASHGLTRDDAVIDLEQHDRQGEAEQVHDNGRRNDLGTRGSGQTVQLRDHRRHNATTPERDNRQWVMLNG